MPFHCAAGPPSSSCRQRYKLGSIRRRARLLLVPSVAHASRRQRTSRKGMPHSPCRPLIIAPSPPPHPAAQLRSFDPAFVQRVQLVTRLPHRGRLPFRRSHRRGCRRSRAVPACDRRRDPPRVIGIHPTFQVRHGFRLWAPIVKLTDLLHKGGFVTETRSGCQSLRYSCGLLIVSQKNLGNSPSGFTYQ